MIKDKQTGKREVKRPPSWGVLPAPTARLVIGANAHPWQHFQALGEIAIWRRLLTEDGIKVLYSRGHGVELLVPRP